MNDQIYQDLKSLHLSGMAQSWMLLHETRKLGELTLQDGMAVLIQAEHDQRTNNRTARLLSQARFRYNASIENLPSIRLKEETKTRSCHWQHANT